MPHGSLNIAATPSVKEAQRLNGSAGYWSGFSGERTFDRFRESERAFIAARDSLYMATVSETGWPYVQHRGGPAGFIHVLDDKTFAVADFRGNRQYISVGNLSTGSRAALILMDYANRRRLKILTHVEIKTATGRNSSAFCSSISTRSIGTARSTSPSASPKPK